MSLKATIAFVPERPGVYLMKDRIGRVIYIGKAKNLKKRVKSYFFNKIDQSYEAIKTAQLLSKVANIDFVVTRNEIEAFLLESNLIKQYRPIFNIELKYQQKYTYLKITEEEYPRLLVARRNRSGDFLGPKGKVYGPFVHGSSKVLSTGSLRKLFKIRICKKLPKRPCLEFFIKNCEAPCISNVTREQYMDKVRMLHEVLSQKNNMKELRAKLRRDMIYASKNQQYEQAKDLRDTLERLGNISMDQKIETDTTRVFYEEFFGIIKNPQLGIAHILSMKRIKGVIMDRNYVSFDLIGDNSLSTFISQYYSSAGIIPRYIYTNEDMEEIDSLTTFLESISGHKVTIRPVKLSKQEGNDKDINNIMDLIMTNLMLYIERGYNPSLLGLRNGLHLDTIPYIIDCFDISNLGTSIAVGACVRFVNGERSKTGYRRFRIRDNGVQNDFAMIEEIVKRRYQFDSEYNIGKGLPLPNLILIDGGKGQLNSAVRTLKTLDIEVPCISLAKGNEGIYTTDRKSSLHFPDNDEGLKMLKSIRDECHRFCLHYNINVRRRIVGK